MIDFSTVGQGTEKRPVAKKEKKKEEDYAVILRTFDVEKAKKYFLPEYEKINQILRDAQTHEIKDDESNRIGVEMGINAQELYKILETRRKEIVEKPRAFVTAINNFVKNFTGPVQQAVEVLKRKTSQYEDRVETERRKAEEAIRKANEKLQRELEEEAKRTGIEPVKVGEVKLPRHDATVRTEAGISYARKSLKVRILDEKLVPREYCVPSMSLLNKAVEMGVTKILGCEIYEDKTRIFKR